MGSEEKDGIGQIEVLEHEKPALLECNDVAPHKLNLSGEDGGIA